METSYLTIVFLLLFFVLLYLFIGMVFLKKRKRLKPYFFLGFFIGITGGFIVFSVLHAVKGSSSFDNLFTWWKFITTTVIILGGSISFYIYYKFFRK